MGQNARGFTIVELLIVIGVIAILAALSYVGYTSLSERASNSAVIDAAAKTKRYVQAYIAATGGYPLTNNTTSACVTTESGCAVNTPLASHATLEANIFSVNLGQPPRTVPISGDTDYGIVLNYYNLGTVDGVSRPMRMQYWLKGTDQPCGIDGVLTTSWPDATWSTAGYSQGVSRGDKTVCLISL